MKLENIPFCYESPRICFSLGILLERARSNLRANWRDIPNESGIYIVRWPHTHNPIFTNNKGEASHTALVDKKQLKEKWKEINNSVLTDILYVGKAKSTRNRVSHLAKFGVGKTARHKGGEHLWQIEEISSCQVAVQLCPEENYLAFENWILESFKNDHQTWPFANRIGPCGMERWKPCAH
jgi:hypothetical protein